MSAGMVRGLQKGITHLAVNGWSNYCVVIQSISVHLLTFRRFNWEPGGVQQWQEAEPLHWHVNSPAAFALLLLMGLWMMCGLFVSSLSGCMCGS